MSQQDDGQTDARKITTAVEEAQNILAEYNSYRLQAARQNYNPDHHPKVLSVKVELHTAVMLAYQRMRPYIKQQLFDDFWRVDLDSDDADQEPWMDYLRSSGGEAGLFILDKFQSPVTQDKDTVDVRHSGEVTEVRYDADLADAQFYRVVVQVLSECMARLGFGPEPREHTPRTEITEETIREFEKWRKKQLKAAE